MYRLKTTANFNIGGGGGTVEEVIHDSTLIGKGTSESPLRVDQSKFAKPTDLNGKQDTLVSGTNIKTINNQSILGSGNIIIESGSEGTLDYNDLENKPKINGSELSGNKTTTDLGLQEKLSSGTNIKTINGASILGSGNLVIESGEGGLSSVAHDDTMTGAGTNASPLKVDTTKIAQKSDIPDTSNFITKSVNDLTNYTKTSDLGDLAIKNTVNYETEVTNKPTIPSEVTEATVSGWGFTKNTGTYSKPSGGIPKSDLDSSVQASLSKADTALQTEQYTGTYSKPSGGIPKSDLASAVQTSLGKADTALQSYTEQYTGTITGITMNGVSKGTSGVVDLGTVITSHQDISGKEDKSNKVTSISSSSTDTQYPSAKAVYEFASSGADESYSLLHDTIDLSDADRSFTGYIYNGAFSGSQEWISYEFKAENIDKILSVSVFTTSSVYRNINFYSEYVVTASQLSSYFISSVPLSDGANKVNNYSNIDVPDNCKAIVISHKIQEGMATPTVTLQIKKYDKEISEIKSDISEISNSSKNVKAIYKDIWNANDFIFIGDELWLTKPSSEYTGYDQEIRRFKLIDGEWVRQSKLYTDFGHWNTVDYCPENDCLIFGNGANSESTTGNYFTVVKNPLALSGSVLTQDVGIKYNVDIGFKVQAVWGNDNMGEHNIVYLTSNYTRRVLKVLLTKDTNGNFDGNFITLNDTTLPTIIGTGGGDFWGDCIYIGDGTDYAIWKLSVSDYTVQKIDRTAYLSDGTAINGSVQGVYVDKDYIWIFYNIGGSSSNYLVQYYKGGLTNKSIVTDDHINSLIDTKLGVIENGSY